MTYIEEIAEAIRHQARTGEAFDEEEQRLYLIYAVLALTIGEDVTRRHVHDAWSAWKAMSQPEHESIQPFDQLGGDVQGEDEPFVTAIQAVARRLRESGTP